ncbi:UDP-Glycosyltransferase/glycogen phosphorylase [Aspergillus recurvatus]
MAIARQKPVVVIACPPAPGHTNPLLAQSTYLTSHGFEVHFLAGAISEPTIRKTGAQFYAVEDAWKPEMFAQMVALPDGPQRFAFGLKRVFIDSTPGASSVLKEVLESIREKDPERDVVIVQEYVSMGVWPFLLGAPLPKGYTEFPKVITFSTVPLTISSIDHAPFGPGLPPDSSEEGRIRNAAMYEAAKPLWDDIDAYADETFAKLGATRKIECEFRDFLVKGTDLLLQPCSPSLEYVRSDMPSNIRFVGAHPRGEVRSDLEMPSWWAEMLAAREEGKKVVFVTQGTFQVDYEMLLKPTMEALREKEDCFVVGVLGVKAATLDGIADLPGNARVADYLPYDAVLPFADVFVSNAGYGGFLHGVMHGVPMVLAGSGQDKAEVCARGEYAGIALNMKTDKPTVEALRDAINTILTDCKYKQRCVEIQQENEALDCRAQVERAVLEFARQ